MNLFGALALAAALAAAPAPDAGTAPQVSFELLRTTEAHRAAILSLALSADGTRALTGAADGTARLWDVSTLAQLADLQGARSQVQAVAFAPGGGAVAAGEQGLGFRVYAPDGGAALLELPHPDSVALLAFSPDGTRLAVSGTAGASQVYGVADGKKQLEVVGRGVGWSRDGRLLLAAAAAGVVRAVDAKTGALKKELKTGTHRPLLAAVLDGPVAVTFNPLEKDVHLYDLGKGAERPALVGHEGPVSSVAVSADGRRAVTASVDKTVRVWDLPARRMLGHLRIDQLSFVALSADGRTLALTEGTRLKVYRLSP